MPKFTVTSSSATCEIVAVNVNVEPEFSAIELAEDIAKFPEMCMRADRRSAIAQWSLDVDEALIQEGAGGYEVATTEAITGAARFSGGAGRHGNFND